MVLRKPFWIGAEVRTKVGAGTGYVKRWNATQKIVKKIKLCGSHFFSHSAKRKLLYTGIGETVWFVLGYLFEKVTRKKANRR